MPDEQTTDTAATPAAPAKEEKKKKPKKQPSPAIGARAEPTVLEKSTKIDIDVDKKFVDAIISTSLSSKLDMSELDKFTQLSNNRDLNYQAIDIMFQDSAVTAVARTYTEDVCETADNGHIMWCESQNPNISKYVNYLLNSMNVDKNIYGWAYCLIKYGDVYLKLYRESDYEDDIFKKDNIDKAYKARNALNENLREELDEAVKLSMHSQNDQYSGYVEMVPDPSTMFELTRLGQTAGFIETPNVDTNQDIISYMTSDSSNVTNSTSTFMYKMKSNDVNIYQADDYVHAILDDNYTRYPETVSLFRTDTDYNSNTHAHKYTVRRGKSLFSDAYKIWREKQLLEASAMLNRITSSSVTRQVSLEVGDMPKEQAQQALRRTKEMFEQKSSYNVGNSMSEYTNPGPAINNVYFATHNGQGAITVQNVGGDFDPKQLTDLDWWNNKFYSSFGIPKQYFGWTEDGAGFNGGQSLTILSSVYAKGVKRVQNALIQAVTDIINLVLIQRGWVSYLNNFTLKMKAPSTQEENDYRTSLTNRINAISSLNSLFSDVDSKPRRLRLLDVEINTLNLGDDLSEILKEEIKDQKQKEEEAAAQAEAEATAPGAAGGEPSLDIGTESGNEAPGGGEDVDLNVDMAQVPEAKESLAISKKDLLTEDSATKVIVEDEENNLPTPEDLGNGIDFTENN